MQIYKRGMWKTLHALTEDSDKWHELMYAN
ncbi:MAG: hypothetical protein QG649_751 [Patescibacteria group bacterium]|nr:hypothetical protein [Patescibacteria group bacterium]